MGAAAATSGAAAATSGAAAATGGAAAAAGGAAAAAGGVDPEQEELSIFNMPTLQTLSKGIVARSADDHIVLRIVFLVSPCTTALRHCHVYTI